VAYDQIITLGGACSPAWQVRNYTGKTNAMPFDWLVLPFRSLVSIIEHDFHGFTEPDAFELTPCGVINRKFPLLHAHDFHLDAENPEGWKIEITTVRSKFEYLINRWRETLSGSNRILFIRHQAHFDEVEFRPAGDLKPIEADRFCASLERLYPNLDFDVLFVTCIVGQPLHHRARTGYVGHDASIDWPDEYNQWRGPTKQWQALLEKELR
jgi:hypothetical protein